MDPGGPAILYAFGAFGFIGASLFVGAALIDKITLPMFRKPSIFDKPTRQARRYAERKG